MHLTFRNINDAFVGLVEYLRNGRRELEKDGCTGYLVMKRPSRNGDVLMIPEPVLITYTHPRERVLFNRARDANPFFHMYEALWMLAGRNDVAPVVYYAKQIKEYSDDGKTLNGAYGYRWRKARTPGEMITTYVDERDGGGLTGPGTQVNRVRQRVDVDQLDVLVAHLRADPNSRRAVLQMWNVEDDLLKIGPGNPSRDTCCNLSVMFSIREEQVAAMSHVSGGTEPLVRKSLDMTVTNRSNDLIWGLLGANYVHFTILQEYLAARLGVEVGQYHHFTNNLHVYTGGQRTARWEPEKWLSDRDESQSSYSWYGRLDTHTVPLVKDPVAFERELPIFVEDHGGQNWRESTDACAVKASKYTEPFLRDVASPALSAFRARKVALAQVAPLGSSIMTYSAVCAGAIKADDWKIACSSWLERRAERVSSRTE